jgi:hypothetical protein
VSGMGINSAIFVRYGNSTPRSALGMGIKFGDLCLRWEFNSAICVWDENLTPRSVPGVGIQFRDLCPVWEFNSGICVRHGNLILRSVSCMGIQLHVMCPKCEFNSAIGVRYGNSTTLKLRGPTEVFSPENENLNKFHKRRGFKQTPTMEMSKILVLSDVLYHCQNAILDSCLAYSSTLKVETICSSETSVDFHRTRRCYIPEDRNLQVKFTWPALSIQLIVYNLVLIT